MKNLITLLILITIGTGCNKNDNEEFCGNPPATYENFLERMNVGDKLYYSMLSGENYFEAGEDVFHYTGDTLVLEVLDISNAGVRISQRITPGSNMMSDSVTYYYDKDSVFTETWNIVGDSLFIESGMPYIRTHLTNFDRLKFSDYSEEEVGITGWRTTYDFAEPNEQLFTTDYTLFGHHYDTLSVYIQNGPMMIDGNGNTAVYSKANGIVRSSEYGWWMLSGYSWDRIY